MAGRKKQEETVAKVNTTSVVQQTIDYLTGAIMRREYTPGSRIPTEMELSDLLGVSRNTVREAVKILVLMACWRSAGRRALLSAPVSPTL